MDVLPEEDADGGEGRREDGGGDAPALLPPANTVAEGCRQAGAGQPGNAESRRQNQIIIYMRQDPACDSTVSTKISN